MEDLQKYIELNEQELQAQSVKTLKQVIQKAKLEQNLSPECQALDCEISSLQEELEALTA